MVKTVSKMMLVATVAASLGATSAMADAGKGQKIYSKKLKKACGFNGAVMAKKHKQSEWKSINSSGKLGDEIKKLCPASKPLKDKYLKDLYDFFYNFASDSGNVPSC
jgi:hypothetical protein